MREMSNQNFENNSVNGTRPLGEGSSLNEDMVENESESVAEEIINVEELNDNVIGSADDTTHNRNDEPWKIVERQNEKMLEGKTKDGIMFKKVDKKIWKAQTDRVNDAIKYLKAETSKKQMISLKLQACG